MLTEAEPQAPSSNNLTRKKLGLLIEIASTTGPDELLKTRGTFITLFRLITRNTTKKN